MRSGSLRRAVSIAMPPLLGVFPVCSPSFLTAHPAAVDFGDPARRKACGALPRLMDSLAETDRSGCGWRSWGEAVGLSWSEHDRIIAFSHGYLALQAAAEGMGVALARRILAADDLASERLVRVGRGFPGLSARFGYYFVTQGEPGPRARSLASWLEGQIAASWSRQ
jgi:LysR family transcriptional regulator, glycine cleavage system transcriptional activator